MADLKLAQTNAVLSINPEVTLLAHLKANYALTNPDADSVEWTQFFTNLSKHHGVIIKLLSSKSPFQTLGAGRIRTTALYKCHVYSYDAVKGAAAEAKGDIEREIKRIIKTNLSGIASFDEIDITDWTEIETGDESAVNRAIAGDQNGIVRSSAIITIIYDEYKT